VKTPGFVCSSQPSDVRARDSLTLEELESRVLGVREEGRRHHVQVAVPVEVGCLRAVDAGHDREVVLLPG